MKIFEKNPELEAKRNHELWLDVIFGRWCGVLLRKKAAVKMIKLVQQHLKEVKTMMCENLDDLEITDWTIDHSDGQENVKYFIPSSDKEKIEKIDNLNIQNLTVSTNGKLENVFEFESREEVKRIIKRRVKNEKRI